MDLAKLYSEQNPPTSRSINDCTLMLEDDRKSYDEEQMNGVETIHSVARMKWCCKISSLLFQKNTIDGSSFVGIRAELDKSGHRAVSRTP